MSKVKNEKLVLEQEDENMGDADDQGSPINIIIPDEVGVSAVSHGKNVPLFLKKLWKIVNEDQNEDVISWNEAGDGFIIHDQLNFVSNTLPKYFRHNHLSSFVRQLNLYDFHKIQNIDRDDYEFSHPFFNKEYPQLLPLIKRKISRGKSAPQTQTQASDSASNPEMQEVINIVEDMKNKNDAISTEIRKLRQENAALWSEMNSLRVKYSSQSKIINKLIHFLISYMQKHHTSRKSGRTVSSDNANKYLKTGPKIMELGYKYKNNPHEFWNDFDSRNSPSDQTEHQDYTVVEPGEDNMEVGDSAQQNPAKSPAVSVSSVIEELLPGSEPFNQSPENSVDSTLFSKDFNINNPSSSKDQNSALQRTTSTQENLGYFIDNSQIELSTIKELLKNMTSDDVANFYKLVNENYKNPDGEPSVDLTLEPDDEITEKDLVALSELAPIDNPIEDLDVPMEFSDDLVNLGKVQSTLNTPQIDLTLNQSPLDAVLNKQQTNKTFSMPLIQSSSNTPQLNTAPNAPQIDTILKTPDLSSELNTPMIGSPLVPPHLETPLNTDDLLNNISVDQYFNID